VGALLLLGAMMVAGGFTLWHQAREQRQLRRAQAEAAALLAALLPKAEARLAQSAGQLDDLQKALTRTPAASRADQLELTRYGVQQKRAHLQADEAEAMLQRISTFLDQAPGQFALPPGRDLLSEEDREKLAGLASQLDRLRQDLRWLAPQMALALERRRQLYAAEAEATQRTQAALEAGLHAQDEAPPLAQTETAPPAQFGTARLTEPDAAPASLTGRTRIPAQPPGRAGVRCVRVVPLRLSSPLVIGAGYPDRFIGYRSRWRSGPYPLVLLPPPPPYWCW
jgi:hypothetical protein